MILANKEISDATALKMVSKLLRRSQPTKGFRVKTRSGEKTLTYDELLQFVDDLATRLDEGSYGVIHRCDTCGNFSRPGRINQRGCCFPKKLTSFRNREDFCSMWIPMDENQKYLKEKMDGYFKSLQTK